MLILKRIWKLESSFCILFSTSVIVSTLKAGIPQIVTDAATDDISILLGGGKYIRPLIPAVVDAFYKKLLQYDVTSQAFVNRSSGYDGQIDDHPTEASPQIQYRKLVRLFCICSGISLIF